MEINLIAVAIPLFFLLIGVELLVSRWQGRRVYRLNDAITDLSCGIGSQVVGVFLKVAVFAGYIAIYDSVRLFDLPAGHWAVWVLAALLVDLAYYAWHRASHRVHLVWATHVPHHQSQDYNLAVALRQAWFSSATHAPFAWPLALLGIPPVVYLVNDALNTLYQFWIHTETVRRLGPLEWVLNTPSHHRVHHGINPRYVDKNYAGVLIVWDRLFGTFEPETEPACYGTIKRFSSWNPVWANFEHWAYLLREARESERWVDKIGVFFRPPEWRAPGRPALPGPADVSPETFVKFDTPTAPGLAPYVLAHFGVVAIAVTTVLWVEETAPWTLLAPAAAAIVWATLNWGGLFEHRAWAVPSEAFRLGAVGSLALAWAIAWPPAAPWAVLLVAFTALSAMWLLRWAPTWSSAGAPLTTARARA